MLGKRYVHNCAFDAWVGLPDDFISDISLNLLISDLNNFEKVSNFFSERNLSLANQHAQIWLPKSFTKSEFTQILKLIRSVIEKNHSLNKAYLRRITFAFSDLKDYESFLEILYETFSE